MKRLCLFALYDRDGGVGDLAAHYLSTLHRCGYEVHVALSGQKDTRRATQSPLLQGLPLQFWPRENRGLDFGAWQDVARSIDTALYDEILLANDSVIGPITPLTPVLARMRHRDLDVWGMVHSEEIVPHLQSWFLSFKGEAFHHPAIQRVMHLPFKEMSKQEIIFHGELGLSVAMRSAKLKTGASWESQHPLIQLLKPNPMHMLWRSVIASKKVPFIKVELLRDNPLGLAGLNDWPALIDAPTRFDAKWVRQYLSRFPKPAHNPRCAKKGNLLQFALSTQKIDVLGAYLRELFRLRKYNSRK